MMRTLKKAVLLLLPLTLCLFPGCTREDEIEGPAFYSPPEGFDVVSFSASAETVDFTSGSVEFNAAFTHKVSWVLTIKGSESGAVKEFRGIGEGFSGITWEGRHDGMEFFKKGEKAVAYLSFMGAQKTWTDEVTVMEPRNYASYGIVPIENGFEDIAMVNYSNGWVAFDLADQGIGSNEKDLSGKPVRPVQGNNYYYLRDKPLQVGQFVDGIRYDGVLSSPVPPDPDSVWVNIYIYGTGNTTTQMNFEFKEDDFDGPTPGHQDTEDDAIVATIFPSHVGWKLYSFRYSDLNWSASAEFGGSGNHIHEPDRIRSLQFGLLKTGDRTKQTELYFDFPIITIGGPFDPSK